MKWLWDDKDGGKESKVWCYGVEIKKLFSIILLRFEDGSREAYHSHAFNCLNWVLKGELQEDRLNRKKVILRNDHNHFKYLSSFIPFIIKKEHLHKVTSIGRTLVLSFRGPWANEWIEYLPDENRFVKLTYGRKEIPWTGS